jgi:hypothetical protein
VKSEVPQQGLRLDLLPWFDAGKRHIEDHHAAGGLRIETSKGIRHDAAIVLTDEINRSEVEFGRELTNILG